MNVPRIRIDDIDKISVLISYLIYALGCPLTKNQIIEITSLEEAVNYFDLMQSLERSTGNLWTVVELNGEKALANTDNGINAAKELADALPVSIREKMYNEAVRVYTRDAMEKGGSFLSADYVKKNDGTCTVNIKIIDTDTTQQKYNIYIETQNEEEAEAIKKKVKEDPNKFAKYLNDYFM